ncbi:MAG: hypothetical protein IJD28_01095, partial [Deferribacterales bacterium]|nr:hypothetical protein [Deferribacterales bacterium]
MYKKFREFLACPQDKSPFIAKISSFFNIPQKSGKFAAIMFAAALLCVLYLSVDARQGQYKVWQSYPQSFFATGTPMMTTLDAYKFTRHAKEYRSGTLDTKAPDPMVFYPDGTGYQDPVPLLSVLLDKFSAISGEDFYNAAISMVPILSSLFIVSLAIYFFLAGYPVAGLLGGLTATFAPMYFGRTSVGRFDTDGMNVFFIITASLFVYLASKSKKTLHIYIYSALAGVTVNLFYWWYMHGMFNIMYAGLIVVCLFIAGVKVKHILGAVAVFTVFSNPAYMIDALGQVYRVVDVYLFPLKDGSATIFPNVYDTIGEAQKNSLVQVLSAVVSKPYLAACGLVLFGLFAIFHIRTFLPLMPLALMGAMAFVSSGRFSMFLGAFVGLGFGWAITVCGAHLSRCAAAFKAQKDRGLFYGAVSWGGAFVILCVFTGVTVTTSANRAFASVPAPSINPNIYQLFKDMPHILPKDSVIYSWWDYGLAIADVTGFKVFQSGTSQDTPKTWLMARSITGSQKDLYNTASYLDTFGISEVKEMAAKNTPLAEIAAYVENYSDGTDNNGLYILFSRDMASKFYPMSYLANMNPLTGKSAPQNIITLNCTDIKDNVLTCDGMRIDYSTGI